MPRPPIKPFPPPRDADDADLLEVIERVGWYAIHVLEEDGEPPFSYTMGLTHTLDHPELVVIGLEAQTSHGILQSAVDQIRDHDAHYSAGDRATRVIESLEMAIVDVEPPHHDNLGWMLWLHDTPTPPALQLVWPDKQGSYPFDDACAPPIKALQPVWTGTIPAPLRWPFDDLRRVAVVTTQDVARGHTPIARVARDVEDGTWRLAPDPSSPASPTALISLEEATRHDPTLLQLADLPPGEVAIRGVGGTWERSGG